MHSIRLAVFLNLFFAVVELIGGLLTNSLALLSDALHDFGDSLTLILAWVLEAKSQRKADERMTFGYRRLSLLSSVIAGAVLIAGSLYILAMAVPRLLAPEPVVAEGLLVIGILGLVVNGIAFWRLHKGHSQNEKVLSWHMAEDLLGWIVIIIGGAIIQLTGYYIIDPIITIGFTMFIMFGVTRHVRESLNIFLQGVPKDIDIKEVKAAVMDIKGVTGMHDVHIWSLDGEQIILTAHVVVEDSHLRRPDIARKNIKKELEKMKISHSTIELESAKFCSGRECD